MFPGTTTKVTEGVIASAATIYPKNDVVRITGATDIDNIIPSFGGGFGGILGLIPTTGVVNLTAAGNIAVAVAMPQNKVTLLFYVKAASKWFPAISA